MHAGPPRSAAGRLRCRAGVAGEDTSGQVTVLLSLDP